MRIYLPDNLMLLINCLVGFKSYTYFLSFEQQNKLFISNLIVYLYVKSKP